MELKRLGKPRFIKAEDVKSGDILTITELPYLVSANESKWGKERYRIVVAKDSDKDWGFRTWTLNVTTWDRLLDAFGDDANKWVGAKVRIRVKEENVRGTPRQVLYGEPYVKAK